jgi:type IV pilus assembly protein PilW
MNMQRKFDRRAMSGRQQGLTLVELMIALVLGSMLMIGAVQLFSGMRSAYQLNEGLSRVQESGRFAVDILSQDLRMAGYMGCTSNSRDLDIGVSSDVATSDIDAFYLNFTRGVEGFEAAGTGPDQQTVNITTLHPEAAGAGNWTPSLPDGFLQGDSRQPIAGSDVLILRYMQGDGVRFVSPYTKGNQYHVTDNQDFQQGDLLFAADCQGGGYLFRRNNNPGGGGGGGGKGGGGDDGGGIGKDNIQPGGGTATEYRTFGPDAEMARPRMVAYFIGVNTAADADPADRRPTLYRRTFNQSGDAVLTDELVSGIETMQVLYGIDQGGNRSVDQYMTADEVEAADRWFAVSSVRVGLLARSESQVVPLGEQTPKDFSLLGTAVNVDIDDDRRHRQIFMTTVNLRNR